LRPTGETVRNVIDLVGDRDRRVLLFGVTPELAKAFDRLVGVDKSRGMIENLWPGDTATRKSVEADWLTLDGSLGQFSAAIGDGSCNCVAYPKEVEKVLEQVRDHLEPGGRFVCRVYLRPDAMPSRAEMQGDPRGKARINFHAFKFLLAMRIAEDSEATVPVVSILAAFEEMFPDRDALAERTDWPRADIDTIDSYRNSSVAYSFFNRAEFLGAMPQGLVNPQFHSSGAYDLAETCPILVCERE
jgi:SAM-dependent methyltransferase